MADDVIHYTKGLPYGLFMKHAMFDMTQRGQLHRIITKWEKLTQRDCKPLYRKGNPLSIEKLCSLFFIPCFGILLAISSLLVENVLSFLQKKNRITKDGIMVLEEKSIIDIARMVLTEIDHMDKWTKTTGKTKIARLKHTIQFLKKYS